MDFISDGEKIQGVSVSIFPKTDLQPTKREKTLGTRPMKGFLSLSVMEKIPAAPAVYDFTFEMYAASDGTPKTRVTELVYKGEYRPYTPPGAAAPPANLPTSHPAEPPADHPADPKKGNR